MKIESLRQVVADQKSENYKRKLDIAVEEQTQKLMLKEHQISQKQMTHE
jgi:hypothetical protein